MLNKMPLPLWKRATFVPLLLFALWLLTDNETNDWNGSGKDRRRHLAVFTALRRHPPCSRVYRSLLEIDLLLWGATLSFWVWNRTIGKKMIAHLLFQPVTIDPSAMVSAATSAVDAAGQYLPVDIDDFAPLHAEDILMLGRSRAHSTQGEEVAETFDAQYDSDGEVSELTATLHAPMSVVSSKVMEPPDVEDLARVAVDSLVLILLSLFFFTLSSSEGGRYVDGMQELGFFRMVAMVAAPIFPLILFLTGIFAAVMPWRRKRREFWKLISLTIGAPVYRVTFRDGFIGDILTSSVRPMRDIAFTFFYLFSGLQGWWKQAYDLDTAGLPLETNWFLHTVIFPACMFSPLWWRFLQNLRQTYEHKKRWPYLGNAFKYFIAAEVAIFGAFNPSRKQDFLWLFSFAAATMYQIWWDVFMDWELLVIENKTVRLRRTRIYSVEWMYWTILVVNIILRFCWTLSFLPPHYLNRAGVLSDQFEGDLSHILNPTIASAEIIRRTLWGFLRVELEAIKVGRTDPNLKGAWSDADDEQEMEMTGMSMEPVEIARSVHWEEQLQPSKTGWIYASDMYSMSEFQILGELCLYATAFTALGLVAAAHRLTF